jgi:hypothetical protein
LVDTKNQLPATIQQVEVTANQPAMNVVPALIATLIYSFARIGAT